MKSDTTTTVLNFVLAMLVILGVAFAILAMKRAAKLRAITPVAMQVNGKMMMVQSLVADVNNYNQQAKSPEITRMLQTLQGQLSTIK
jgi:Tfp pilus assembly protein PilO